MKTIVGLIWFAGLILFQAANAVNNFTNPGFPSNFQIELTVGPKETPSSKQEEVLPISLASNVLGATTYSLTLSTLSCRITWAADSSQPLICLILMNGQQEIVLLNQQPNTGNYIWTPPENLPSGTYTFVIGTGPPDDLSGQSTSATFVIQPCSTCYSVPSTALFTPGQTPASETETNTKTSSSSKTESTLATFTQSSISEHATTSSTHSPLASTAATATESTSAAVTPTGTATATESGVSAASGTTPVESHSSTTEGQSIGTSTTGQPLPSLGPTISASGTTSAKSVAGKVEYGGTGKWIGIVAGMMGLWIVPMMI